MSEAGHKPEVVRDKQHCRTSVVAKTTQQGNDLGLNCHVKCSCGLIREDQ
jgi:hypothetical protein